MAPGVSAALITTVTGLLVAIPAMFGYNFLVTTIPRISSNSTIFRRTRERVETQIRR
jgi:biopolymer transport protein ExbB/TolQ